MLGNNIYPQFLQQHSVCPTCGTCQTCGAQRQARLHPQYQQPYQPQYWYSTCMTGTAELAGAIVGAPADPEAFG